MTIGTIVNAAIVPKRLAAEIALRPARAVGELEAATTLAATWAARIPR